MNEFVARNGLIALDSSSISGPLTVRDSLIITGSTQNLLKVDSIGLQNILFVSSSGNIGINTNSLLYGSAANSAGRLTINNTSGNNGLVIRNADDGYALSVKTTTNDTIGVQFTWYNGATQTFLQHTGTVTRIGTNVAGYSSAVFDPSVIQFLFGTSEVARLTSGGNLGIGITSPLYSLDILSPTGTEPLTTNVDNYAARIKRTYTNNSGSVSSRRYNTFFDTTYSGNQAYTNTTGLYNYINYQNTNANTTITGIVSYIEPVSTVSGSSLTSFAAQVGTGGLITSVTGYNANLLSLTAGTTTNARLFRAEALGSTNTITNLYGFIAESTLTSATNNYGFYGNIASGTGRWNIYMAGTANNYLAGNLGLGVTSPLSKLHVDLNNNQYIYFGGADQSAGIIRGIRFGYGQSGPYYWKSAIIQEQTGDGAARGKIHILNNNQFGIDNASLSDARLTILASGEVGINNQSPTYRLDVNGSFRASGSITATSGSDYFDISHDITQPAQTGSQVYEVNITPTLRYTAPNQTQTALRVAATFSGSTALSSSQSNIIADFGSTSAGSQLVINDTTSGSIYMVNDVSGLPIIEANSNWDVFIYDYPNVVLRKTGSVIQISGSLINTGSFGSAVINANNSQALLTVSGTNTVGGAGYIDFLRVTNTSSSIATPNKTFRLNTTGDIEIINSAYTGNILTISENGNMNLSGSLTMPNRPAFRVSGSSITGIAATTTITSTQGAVIDYNQGSHYNNSTGVFTAPIAGLYHVYMNLRTQTTGAQQAILYKNDSIALLMWESNTDTGHFGVSSVIYLAANDNIRVKVVVGTVQFDQNDSWGAAYIG